MTSVGVLNRSRASGNGAPSRPRYLPGEVGLWVFILGDMAFFSLFFGMVMAYRGQEPEIFAAAQGLLHTDLAVINTLVLLTGSFFVAKALNVLRRGGRADLLVAATMGCAITFATIKIAEYVDLVSSGYTVSTNDFFMYYFVFTGIHLLHLLIGFGMLVALFVVSMKTRKAPLTLGRRKLAETAAVFWHMVDLLWLVLFPLFYVVH